MKYVIVCLLLLPAAPALAEGIWGEVIFGDAFDATVDACPAIVTLPNGTQRTLVKRASISYGVYQAERPNIDVTEWDNMWGYNNVQLPTPHQWPGVGGAAPVIRAFPARGYLCMHFRTPANMSAFSGTFSNPSYVAGPDVTMAISALPGDFSAALPSPGCLKRDVPTSDGNLVLWKGTPNAPGNWCNLQPDSDYYANVTFASTSGCSTSTCVIGSVSYHN